jgi:hypothetical protein
MNFMRNISILAAFAFICFYVAIRKIIHPGKKNTKITSKPKRGHK